MNIQKLLNLLNDNNLPELFEELDKLNIQDSKYARFKQEFIGGSHSYDFWDRLKVFIQQLDKPKNDEKEIPNKESKRLSINQLKEIVKAFQPKIEISPKFENIGNPVVNSTNINTNQNTLSNQQTFQIEAFRNVLLPMMSRLEMLKEDLEETEQTKEVKMLAEQINKLLKSAEKVSKEEDKDKIRQSAFVERIKDFFSFLKKENKSLLSYVAPENLKKIEESAGMIKEMVEKI
ncbi:MAG: hypothetical protein MUE81_13320 [Thermoflexibacter sp.]|jgi:hypothetical protein|nr:hypothetical protein [Thermoflexibacter sp.]